MNKEGDWNLTVGRRMAHPDDVWNALGVIRLPVLSDMPCINCEPPHYELDLKALTREQWDDLAVHLSNVTGQYLDDIVYMMESEGVPIDANSNTVIWRKVGKDGWARRLMEHHGYTEN